MDDAEWPKLLPDQIIRGYIGSTFCDPLNDLYIPTKIATIDDNSLIYLGSTSLLLEKRRLDDDGLRVIWIKRYHRYPRIAWRIHLIYRSGGLKIWTGIQTCFDDNQLISRLKMKLSDSMIRFILYVTVKCVVKLISNKNELIVTLIDYAILI